MAKENHAKELRYINNMKSGLESYSDKYKGLTPEAGSVDKKSFLEIVYLENGLLALYTET